MILPISFLYFFGSTMYNVKPDRKFSKEFFRYCMFCCGIIGITVLFHALFFLQDSRQEYITQLFAFGKLGLTDNFMGFCTPRLSTVFQYLVGSLTWVGVLVALMGFLILLVEKRPLAIFLFLWFAVPVIFYGNLHTTYTPRFFALVLPPLLLCQGRFFPDWQKWGSLLN